MNVWAVAWRNVGRNLRRSLLSGGIVLFGFVALALAGGFMAQSFEALREGTIRGGTGHLQIARPEWFSAGGSAALSEGIEEPDRLAARLRREAAVVEVLERIDFQALLSDGERSLPCLGAGVDPQAEARVMDLPSLVATGRWLGDRRAREAVLGSGLAAAFRAEPGSTLTVLAMTAEGVLNAVDLEIVGIARLPVRELDERYLATTLGAADQLLQAQGRVSKLVVLLDRAGRAERVGAHLRDALASPGNRLEVRTWTELALFYRQVRQLYLGIFGFLGIVLVIIVLLATANTMLMAVSERTREVGTLRALGARRARVSRLFVAEGALLGALGCACGAVFALVLRELLNRAGIELPPPPGVAHPIPLHIAIFPAAYLTGMVAMVSTTTLAAWWAARRASRRPIVDALGHV